jgi:hypothetical protein
MKGVGSGGLRMLTLANLAFLVKTRAGSRLGNLPTLRIPAVAHPVTGLEFRGKTQEP